MPLSVLPLPFGNQIGIEDGNQFRFIPEEEVIRIGYQLETAVHTAGNLLHPVVGTERVPPATDDKADPTGKRGKIKVQHIDRRRNKNGGMIEIMSGKPLYAEPGAKGITCQEYISFPSLPHPGDGAANVILFAEPVVISSLAPTHSPEIESQG